MWPRTIRLFWAVPRKWYVATNVPGNRDLVSDGQNGLLVPLGDAAALRQALLSVATDPERCQGMSKTSRSLADRYSWQAVSAALKTDLRPKSAGAPRRSRPGPTSADRPARYLVLAATAA